MWDKAPQDQCLTWHFDLFNYLHKEHNTDFFSEYDEEKDDNTMKYNNLGLWPTQLEKQVNSGDYTLYLTDSELKKAAYASECRFGLSDELADKIYNYLERKTGENHRF
jgi:hypothetical protein